MFNSLSNLKKNISVCINHVIKIFVIEIGKKWSFSTETYLHYKIDIEKRTLFKIKFEYVKKTFHMDFCMFAFWNLAMDSINMFIKKKNELAHCKNVNIGKHAKDNLSILEIELNFNKWKGACNYDILIIVQT